MVSVSHIIFVEEDGDATILTVSSHSDKYELVVKETMAEVIDKINFPE